MKKISDFDLTRRHFLATGSAVAATAGFSSVVHAGTGSFALQNRRTAKLSIAYMQGSDTWEDLHNLAPTLDAVTEDSAVDMLPIVAADTMLGGDLDFVDRSARVSVLGLISEPSKRLPAMLLKSHARPYHEAAHVAWGFEGSALCCSYPANSFTVPIDAAVGLQLSLEVRPRGSDTETTEPAVAEANFGLGVLPGGAKLRRGVYLMTWGLSDGPMLPDWSPYRVIAERVETPEEGRQKTRRFMVTDASGKPKALPAAMLTIDYGDDKPA